jgi:hypothetical protein
MKTIDQETRMKTTIHKDNFSHITHDPATNLVQIVWLPATAEMTLDDFKHSTMILAETTLAHSSERVLADLRGFRFNVPREFEAWRMQNTVPRYNKVVKRYAWLAGAQPPQLPGDGKAHQNEGETYIRCWFRDEAKALSWVTSEV